MINDLKNIIIRSQRTQRNWDLSQSIKNQDLELFKIAVSECPAKQNRIWYNVVFVKDRNIIEKIYNTTIEWADKVEEAQRGDAGFGSSGK